MNKKRIVSLICTLGCFVVAVLCFSEAIHLAYALSPIDEPNVVTVVETDLTEFESEASTAKSQPDQAPTSSSKTSNEVIQSYDYYVSLTPSQVQNVLTEHEWNIICMDEADLQIAGGFSEHIMGFTDFEVRTIYIAESDQRTVLHEIGHAIDFEYGFRSLEPDAVQIYEQEKDSYFTAFTATEEGLYDAAEYFADAFDVYIRYGSVLHNACPETYAAIEWFICHM